MEVCTECGFEAVNYTGLGAHQRGKHGAVTTQRAEPAVAVLDPVAEPRSDRGRRRRARDQRVLSPLEQIRGKPTEIKGAWAYYINPDGATIRDALLLYPNGARLPRSEDPRGKFSENAEYYQARQARKGLEYVGPTLNDAGVRRLVEVLGQNREDEVLDLEDLVAECQRDIENSDRPEWRDNQRKRRDQLQKRLDTVRAGFNPEALIGELNEIARAQRMARVDGNVLAVMREMMGEMNSQFAAALGKFESKASGPDDRDAVWSGQSHLE